MYLSDYVSRSFGLKPLSRHSSYLPNSAICHLISKSESIILYCHHLHTPLHLMLFLGGWGGGVGRLKEWLLFRDNVHWPAPAEVIS